MKQFFLISALAAFLFAATQAWADGGKPAPLLPKIQQECSSCHIAFRSNFLPRSSWQQVMASLNHHYGVDASLSEADTLEIAAWFNANALEAGEVPPQNRMTKAFWFTRKHNPNRIKAEVWTRASIGSASNCAACHANADQGDFNEHATRIPR